MQKNKPSVLCELLLDRTQQSAVKVSHLCCWFDDRDICLCTRSWVDAAFVPSKKGAQNTWAHRTRWCACLALWVTEYSSRSQRRTRPEQISISAMLQIRCQESCLVIVVRRTLEKPKHSPPARSRGRECSPRANLITARMLNQQECPKGWWCKNIPCILTFIRCKKNTLSIG